MKHVQPLLCPDLLQRSWTLLSLAVLFCDRKWRHIREKQVLPPVSQLKLITLSEKARVTCSRSRFNLTSHILVVLFVQITVKNPWTNALILSLSVNASVFILEKSNSDSDCFHF